MFSCGAEECEKWVSSVTDGAAALERGDEEDFSMSLVKECKQVRAAYLELRGGTVVTRWKRYWVVLNTDEIVYYSSPTTTVCWRKGNECAFPLFPCCERRCARMLRTEWLFWEGL